ncbi:MAG: hypothetical protein RL448_192 [Actinomycetota bacterium]
MKIRELTSIDLPSVVSLEREIFKKDAWSVGQFKEELAGVPLTRYYLIAENDENELIGYGGIAQGAPNLEADIHTLAVAESSRRTGVARALMTELENWAIKRSASDIFLEMRTSNVEAKPLYESLGYEVISTRRNYYGTGVDAFVMRKVITK